jgi:ribonuclease D
LRTALVSQLETQSKLEWAVEEFKNLVHFKPRVKDAEKWRSVSGLHALKDRRKLAIVKSLWQAREELAQKLDVSPGRLIPDSSLIEVAQQEPKTRAELLANKKFAGRASRSYSDLWWHAVEDGNRSNDLPEVKVKSGTVPHHRFWKRKHPEAFQRLEECRKEIQALSEQHSLPGENILTPDLLRQLCWDTELNTGEEVREFLSAAGARTWQVALVGEPLSQALSAAADPLDEIQN